MNTAAPGHMVRTSFQGVSHMHSSTHSLTEEQLRSRKIKGYIKKESDNHLGASELFTEEMLYLHFNHSE